MKWLSFLHWCGTASTQAVLFFGCWQLVGNLMVGLFVFILLNVLQFIEEATRKVGELRDLFRGR